MDLLSLYNWFWTYSYSVKYGPVHPFNICNLVNNNNYGSFSVQLLHLLCFYVKYTKSLLNNELHIYIMLVLLLSLFR